MEVAERREKTLRKDTFFLSKTTLWTHFVYIIIICTYVTLVFVCSDCARFLLSFFLFRHFFIIEYL